MYGARHIFCISMKAPGKSLGTTARPKWHLGRVGGSVPYPARAATRAASCKSMRSHVGYGGGGGCVTARPNHGGSQIPDIMAGCGVGFTDAEESDFKLSWDAALSAAADEKQNKQLQVREENCWCMGVKFQEHETVGQWRISV
jgi:hypothetical protein